MFTCFLDKNINVENLVQSSYVSYKFYFALLKLRSYYGLSAIWNTTYFGIFYDI